MGKFRYSTFVFALALFASGSLHAQAAGLQPDNSQTSEVATTAPPAGTIVGTLTDVNDFPVSGATVALEGSDHSEISSVTTNDNGFFQIRDVQPGNAYQVRIRAAGFQEWESAALTLGPGEYKIEDTPQLRLEEVTTSVVVTPATNDEIAIEQVKTAENQRLLGGLIPNFYAIYSPDPAPLNAKLRFTLALRLARDPFSFAAVGFLAGIGQATNYPRYGQGLKGYSERYGAEYANDFTDIMLNGAILPSLLHQDPRYYYDGKGSIPSRALHAISSLVIARGDNGQLEPNFSAVGGDLGAAAISNLYYPKVDRGMNIVLQGFAINTGAHLLVRLIDEFVFRPPVAQSDRTNWNNRLPCTNNLVAPCNN